MPWRGPTRARPFFPARPAVVTRLASCSARVSLALSYPPLLHLERGTWCTFTATACAWRPAATSLRSSGSWDAPLLTEADQSKQTPFRQFARREVSSVCQCQAPGNRQTAAVAPAGCSRYRSSPGRSAQSRHCREYPWHRPPGRYPSHSCLGLSSHDAVVRDHSAGRPLTRRAWRTDSSFHTRAES